MTHKKDIEVKNIPKKAKTVTCLDGYDESEDLIMPEISNEDEIVANLNRELIPAKTLSVPSRTPKSLVIEALIEQLIWFHEDDVHKRKKLFRLMCRKLSDLGFIDSSFHLEALQPFRFRFRTAFGKLITDIKKSVGSTDLINSTALLSIQATPLDLDSYYRLQILDADYLRETSQYETDFEEISTIAQGGFGVVCKARKKVDNVEYAIKKIPFTYNGDSVLQKVLREVEVFAKLSHPNIVAYKTAWVERQTVLSTVVHASSDESDYSTTQPTPTKSENWQPNEASGMSTALSLRRVNQPYNHQFLFSNDSEDCCETRAYQSLLVESCRPPLLGTLKRQLSLPYVNKGSSYNKLENLYDAKENELEAIPCIRGTLFIQMELCMETLKDWLDNRMNTRETESIFSLVDESEVMHIFKQVLKGVDYLHQQGLIHRDLKPLNILLNDNLSQVKIGDFGLATMCCTSPTLKSTILPWQESHHSKGVGTSPYAAPEQKTKQIYNNKADMYSLGIILLELLQPFRTLMERAKCLEKLFSTQTVPCELFQRFPRQATIIKMLVNETPESRPTATELLKSDLFCKKSQVIDKQQKEIVRLRQELLLKDNEILQLKRKIYELGLL